MLKPNLGQDPKFISPKKERTQKRGLKIAEYQDAVRLGAEIIDPQEHQD